MMVGNQLTWKSIGTGVRKANLFLLFGSVVVTVLYVHLRVDFFATSSTPLSIMGAALTIFLGFRTNSAYGRWWEARTLWGGIVNNSRTLARQTLGFVRGASPETGSAFAREMIFHQIAWVNAVRAHLRKQDPLEAVRPYLPAEVVDDLNGQQNVPAAILMRMEGMLHDAHESGMLDSIKFAALDDTLTELTNLLGGCERIKNTLLPRQYDYFPRLFVYAYCTLLPIGLVESLKWWTPLVCAIITFIFIAIDSIGTNIEAPFENTIHDTPMSALCRTIEINLRQMLGDKEEVPRPLEPVCGVLD